MHFAEGRGSMLCNAKISCNMPCYCAVIKLSQNSTWLVMSRRLSTRHDTYDVSSVSSSSWSVSRCAVRQARHVSSRLFPMRPKCMSYVACHVEKWRGEPSGIWASNSMKQQALMFAFSCCVVPQRATRTATRASRKAPTSVTKASARSVSDWIRTTNATVSTAYYAGKFKKKLSV